MTKKKVVRNFGRWSKFFREMLTFFRETPKKVVKKFRLKFGPPVSEVLDPLVAISTTKKSFSHFALKVLVRFLFKNITNREVIKLLCPPKPTNQSINQSINNHLTKDNRI